MIICQHVSWRSKSLAALRIKLWWRPWFRSFWGPKHTDENKIPRAYKRIIGFLCKKSPKIPGFLCQKCKKNLGPGYKIKQFQVFSIPFPASDTLPETNIAGWKIHHFDGIYQDTWGFSWASFVSLQGGYINFHVLSSPGLQSSFEINLTEHWIRFGARNPEKTTCYLWKPMKNGIFSISTGAGLLPSTVANTFFNINIHQLLVTTTSLKVQQKPFIRIYFRWWTPFRHIFFHESNPVLP